MRYSCPKVLCALYESCPCNRLIPAQEQSDPDEDTGESLYFAACSEQGETFCNLHADELLDDDVSRNGADNATSVPDSIGRLYGQMAFVNLSNDDNKLRMGLAALSEYVMDCISPGEVRMFGCPLFMRTVCEIDKTKVASIRLTESEEAEGLWTDFKNKMDLALDILSKRGLAGAETMKEWLHDCGEITGQAGSYHSYRRIRHEALDGLLEYCRDMAILNHANCKEAIQLIYAGIFDEIESMPAFFPTSHVGRTETVAQIGVTYQSPTERDPNVKCDVLRETIKAIVKEQTDRTIKVINKRHGETNALIKRGAQVCDKRPRTERKQIDKVVRLYILKHDIERNEHASISWCCRQVLGRGRDGKYDSEELRKLDNAVRYDIKSFYDIDTLKAEIQFDSKHQR